MSSGTIPFEDTSLDSPHLIQQRLVDIERDLALRQNLYEAAARGWYTAQRDLKRVHARTMLSSTRSTVTEKKAEADLAVADIDGAETEAEYEALKAVIRVLETRATVCMSVLKAQSR